MQTALHYDKQIFCIEGDWNEDLRQKDSIENALKFMETAHVHKIKYIHRHASTKEELQSRINQYTTKQYEEFSIFYLAFHGVPNGLKLNQKNILTLDELGEMCEGKLKNKILHLGSCETLNISKSKIKDLLRQTNALCISGFKKEVPFISSTIFDILYFEMCQYYKRMFTIESNMKKYYAKLIKELEFVMIYE
jgi:hypothetical protein